MFLISLASKRKSEENGDVIRILRFSNLQITDI